MEQLIKLVGAPQSPYSRKMRAALRYRRIPYQWIRQYSAASEAQPQVKISHMIPVLWFSHEGENAEHDTAMLDSTFQLQKLEEMYAKRSLVSADPVLNIFDALIEDFADEWLTKAMFHYRWSQPQDIKKAGTLLPLETSVLPSQQEFANHQVGRLGVVGSNKITTPLIEESFINILQALNKILTQQPFVLGHRPGAADFALYGQLVCLTQFDPTSSELTLKKTPRVTAWVEAMEDLSGDEVNAEGWLKREDLKNSLAGLLNEIGRTYVPYLLANETALKENKEQFSCMIDGRLWQQKPFLYQGKCLMWLRQEFNALSDSDQVLAIDVMSSSGCQVLFS